MPPVGVEHVTVVGIATMPDEVLPDGLYPRQTMILSPDIALATTACPTNRRGTPPLEETILQMAPEDVRDVVPLLLDRGAGGRQGRHRRARGVQRRRRQAHRRAAAGAPGHAGRLHPRRQDHDGRGGTAGRALDATDRGRPRRAGRSRPVPITAFVVGLGLARELVRAHDDQVMWWRLGLTRRERVPILARPCPGGSGGRAAGGNSRRPGCSRPSVRSATCGRSRHLPAGRSPDRRGWSWLHSSAWCSSASAVVV